MGILRNPFPADEMPPAAPQGPLAAAIAPKKPGFFDGGGTGSKIASFLLEALSGVPSAAHREQRQDRDMAQMEQRGLLAQQLEMHKWQQQQEYQRAHPSPYRFEANNGDQMEYDPASQQARTLFADPTQRLVRNYDGTWSVPPVAPSAAPQKPVGKLTPIMPGGAGSGPRTFR